MELDDPRERELALDRLRWTLLDELAGRRAALAGAWRSAPETLAP